jgi:hypothetical protein
MAGQLGHQDTVALLGDATGKGGHLCGTTAPTMQCQDEWAFTHFVPCHVTGPEGLEAGDSLSITLDCVGSQGRRCEPCPRCQRRDGSDREWDLQRSRVLPKEGRSLTSIVKIAVN